MKSRWNDEEAKSLLDNPLALRVYTSRLMGNDPFLVMHGGGNTSVKVADRDFFGDPVDVLYVKGSGWDLATIEPQGFAPVRLEVLKRLATFETLADSDMVRVQKSAMLDPSAPGPSVEAILHGILPFRFVDHTHADAVVTLSNTPDGESRIRDLYGDSVLIVPYIMPGFLLAQHIFKMTRETDWSRVDGMVLMSHGVFTFHDDGRQSYERMIEMVDAAEQALKSSGAWSVPRLGADENPRLHPPDLAAIRRRVGKLRGFPVYARLDDSAEARGFADRPDAAEIATRGPLTPDHVIRTKRVPVVLDRDPSSALTAYAEHYQQYFDAHNDGSLSRLDPAPRWALWQGLGSSAHGTLAFGRSIKETEIISDIVDHTRRAIQWAEHLGGWTALPAKDIFEVEYWELEQLKLKKAGSSPPLQGKVAWVTGAASGIGKATAEQLVARGAAVVALDLDPSVEAFGSSTSASGSTLGLICDVTDPKALERALQQTVQTFGGLDILVSNAGTFPPGELIEKLDHEIWNRSLEINLTSHQRVLKATIPVLRHGFDPSVVFVGSKNVPAPGPGAGAYSAAKAGLTQLARVAALELGADGIRVNVLHPNGVFDTALWTDEVLAARAEKYGITVEAYKTNNVLGCEVSSQDVARAACALADDDFRATTGAQIPIDGGNDRVI